MSEGKKEATALTVPTDEKERSSRSNATAGATSSRNTSPAGNTRSQKSPAELSAELTLKVKAQMARYTLLKEMQGHVTEVTSLEELLEFKVNIEDLTKMFTNEHTYFESVWPTSCIDHDYFKSDIYLKVQRVYSNIKREIARARSSWPSHDHSSSTASSESTSRLTRLPDISLPEFRGVYSEWPAFSDLFRSLILDNDRLTKVEQLHYLRGCLKEAPAQLISNLPLTGPALDQAWELLISRYENKRLIIQSHLDQLFAVVPAQRSSSSLNQLITTVSEAQKALLNLGVGETLGDHLLVYHASKHLGHATREAWELSLGSSQDYPSFQKFQSFVTARVRALERLEVSRHVNLVPTLRKLQPSPIKDLKVSSTSRTTAFAHSATAHPCDQCEGPHFIVACEQFRRLIPTARRKVAEQKRLCFNCLGRHSVNVCRSTQTCKTCAGKHHTMLHESTQTTASTGNAQSINSTSAQ